MVSVGAIALQPRYSTLAERAAQPPATVRPLRLKKMPDVDAEVEVDADAINEVSTPELWRCARRQDVGG